MKVESSKRLWRTPAVYVLPVPVLAVFWLLFFYAYCVRVRLALGHAPASIAEHGGLNGSWHHRAAWWLLGMLVYATPIWSLAVTVAAGWSRRWRRAWVFVALALPWLMWVFVNYIDPGRWFDWFLD